MDDALRKHGGFATSNPSPAPGACGPSHVEQLLQLPHGIVRIGHAMSDRAAILENLVVVAALVRLVAEEMDGGVVDAADVLLVQDVLEAVGLVPTGGENIEGDLPTDGVGEAETGELVP